MKRVLHNNVTPVVRTVVLVSVSLALALFLFIPAISSAHINSGWGYRIKITVNHTKVKSDVTNFPVYVNLGSLPTSFFSNVKSTGGDIRVFSSDGMTELPREIVSLSTTTKTGELYFLAPTLLSKTDSKFYLYYGNAGATDYAATDTFGRNAVWRDYARVYHGSTVDSSGNFDGVFHGAVSETTIVSKFGSSAIAYATNDTANDFAVGAVSGRTIQGWLRDTDSGDNYSGYFVDARANLVDGWVYYGHSFGYPLLTYGDPFTGYLNGNSVALYSASASTTFDSWGLITVRTLAPWTNDSLVFGNRYERVVNNDAFVGQMDELRITKTRDLTPLWIKTEYNNQNSPDTFYKIGNQKQLKINREVSEKSASDKRTGSSSEHEEDSWIDF